MVLVIFAVVKFSCFYLFIYYLYLTSAVLYSYLCGLFIGLCASAMFNSHFSLVIGVFDKPKKVIKSRDFVRVIRTINNIISINLSFHLISVCLLPQSGIHTVKLRHKPYTNTRIWQHLKPYSKGYVILYISGISNTSNASYLGVANVCQDYITVSPQAPSSIMSWGAGTGCVGGPDDWQASSIVQALAISENSVSHKQE